MIYYNIIHDKYDIKWIYIYLDILNIIAIKPKFMIYYVYYYIYVYLIYIFIK